MGRPLARADVDRHLPLKPLVFQVLLALADGERHGWSLVREVQQRGGFARIMPGNLYRTIRALLADGMIAESRARPARDEDDERRRYFKLTPLGAQVASAEARRLEALLLEARAKRAAGEVRRMTLYRNGGRCTRSDPTSNTRFGCSFASRASPSSRS
jgi:DNA-binding PadR family transcriptional regulator